MQLDEEGTLRLLEHVRKNETEQVMKIVEEHPDRLCKQVKNGLYTYSLGW